MFCKVVLTALIIYLIHAPLVKGNCSRYGGVCVKTKKCSSGEYEMQCADQANKCCAKEEVPEENRCRSMFGGECIPSCPKVVLKDKALDCDAGLSCCAWTQ